MEEASGILIPPFPIHEVSLLMDVSLGGTVFFYILSYFTEWIVIDCFGHTQHWNAA